MKQSSPMDLNEILIFNKVVQTGSFTAAAQALSLPKSTVSRKVSLLEKRLGIVLLHRTTRKMHTTEAGSLYYKRCSQLLAELQEAETAATHSQSAPQGLLRITAPVEIGTSLFGDLIPQFLKMHPQVSVDLILTDRIVDLVSEGVDLALRAGDLNDSSLIARKLGNGIFHLMASPHYLKKNSKPNQPKNLTQHQCLHVTNLSEKPAWQLVNSQGQKQIVTVTPAIRSNSLSLLRELALNGNGIALLPYFLCKDDINKNKLVRVLPDWSSGNDPFYAVYPQQRFVAPKIRAFLDFIVTNCTPFFTMES